MQTKIIRDKKAHEYSLVTVVQTKSPLLNCRCSDPADSQLQLEASSGHSRVAYDYFSYSGLELGPRSLLAHSTLVDWFEFSPLAGREILPHTRLEPVLSKRPAAYLFLSHNNKLNFLIPGYSPRSRRRVRHCFPRQKHDKWVSAERECTTARTRLYIICTDRLLNEIVKKSVIVAYYHYLPIIRQKDILRVI